MKYKRVPIHSCMCLTIFSETITSCPIGRSGPLLFFSPYNSSELVIVHYIKAMLEWHFNANSTTQILLSQKHPKPLNKVPDYCFCLELETCSRKLDRTCKKETESRRLFVIPFADINITGSDKSSTCIILCHLHPVNYPGNLADNLNTH